MGSQIACVQADLHRQLRGPIHLQLYRKACVNESEETTALSMPVTPCPKNSTDIQPIANKRNREDKFRTNSTDNDKAMSIDDHHFLDIMEKFTEKNLLGS